MTHPTNTPQVNSDASNEDRVKSMRLWIDCEFNEFRGALISMALVAEDGEEFYEVLPCANPGAWVAQNVMPFLGKDPLSIAEFQMALFIFLRQYEAIHIVADWPEDILHFCASLITGPGMRLDTPRLTMEVRRDLDAESKVPHNALWDARAIKEKHLLVEASAPAIGARNEPAK